MADETHETSEAGERSDMSGFLTSILAREGSQEAALKVLANDSLKARRQKQRVQKELADLKEAHERQRTLSDEDAARFDAYAALGTPEEVTARLAKQEELAAKLARQEHDARVREAADALGWKASVLGDLVGVKQLTLGTTTVTEQDRHGKRTEKSVPAFDVDGTAVAVEQYVAEHLADYLPSLQGGPVKTRDVPFPDQRTTRATGSTVLSDEERIAQKRATGAYSI